MLYSILLLLALILPVSITLYVLSTFLLLVFHQARSPLRHLPGPPSPSFFMGNLREMHDQENTNLVARWEAAYGSTFVYRGFIGGRRLMTTDPMAVAHILGRGYDYPKPDFIRDSLASMAAGHEGLLTIEGEDHRRQRKILAPAFSSAHVKSLSHIFWKKAVQLRDIWLDIAGVSDDIPSMAVSPPLDPFSPPPQAYTTSSAQSTGFLPNPFASFVPSKASPSPETILRNNTPAYSDKRPEQAENTKIDVLVWLARATLDVIGEAGFGYYFNSLSSAVTGGEENPLASAFAVIFSSARKFRVITILQVWFPILRKFKTENAAMQKATATMRSIGLTLIQERRTRLLNTLYDEKTEMFEDDAASDGKDLLSVLIRSNMASDLSQRLTLNEILCQISTFLAAGHETTSSALTWILYALARAPHTQRKLRASLRELQVPLDDPPTPDEFQSILNHPYLDACVRESLRLHAPVTSTMRVAAHTDSIPVSAPFYDKLGRLCDHIMMNKGDIITVPLQEIQKARAVWGEDADEFRPERWAEGRARSEEGGPRGVQGLWGGILTFGSGNVVNGNRSCIGYRFALNEIKIFLFVFIRDIEFSIDPSIEIEKKVNVVTRPCVKSEPQLGNQMPLQMRRVVEVEDVSLV